MHRAKEGLLLGLAGLVRAPEHSGMIRSAFCLQPAKGPLNLEGLNNAKSFAS